MGNIGLHKIGKMSEQLSIFASGICCAHCKNDPGVSFRNGYQWDGFFDADTQQYVCRKCKQYHYTEKRKTEFAGMYSEVPVVVEQEKYKKKSKKEKHDKV